MPGVQVCGRISRSLALSGIRIVVSGMNRAKQDFSQGYSNPVMATTAYFFNRHLKTHIIIHTHILWWNNDSRYSNHAQRVCAKNPIMANSFKWAFSTSRCQQIREAIIPWGTAVPGRPTRWCPGCRRWISSGGRWGRGSGSGLPSSAWCAWCCCRCGPSWRGGAGVQCPGGWWRRWCSPGYRRGALTTEPCLSKGKENDKADFIYSKLCSHTVLAELNGWHADQYEYFKLADVKKVFACTIWLYRVRNLVFDKNDSGTIFSLQVNQI